MYTKIKAGVVTGVKIAFVSGIVTPLFIELIADTHKFIIGSQIRVFFSVIPSLYIAIVIFTFFLLIVPCILGGCFQAFIGRDDPKHPKSISLIAGVISLFSLPAIWKLYANGSSIIDLVLVLIFAYVLHTIMFFFFQGISTNDAVLYAV